MANHGSARLFDCNVIMDIMPHLRKIFLVPPHSNHVSGISIALAWSIHLINDRAIMVLVSGVLLLR